MAISGVEAKILNSLEFSCQNDECEEKVAFGSYFKHMKRDCKVQTYKKILLPEGMAKVKQRLTQEHLDLANKFGGYLMLAGDLPLMFYDKESDEQISKQRKRKHD